MQKRCLSFLLILSMLMSFLPANVLAETAAVTEGVTAPVDAPSAVESTDAAAPETATDIQESTEAVNEVELVSPQGAPATTGTCGEDLTWSFDAATGTLTISGEGAMEDYSYKEDAGAPWQAFRDSIKTASITEGVTYIGKYALNDYPNLSAVSIPTSVTEIGSFAFQDCPSLTEITIPEGVTDIGGFSFSRCTGLASAFIPASVTYIGICAFEGCTGITAIDVDEANTRYSSMDGVVINELWGELVAYPAGKQGAYTIPDCVTEIGYCAFSGCRGLTDITIPASVTYISYSAFENCTGLTTITIPESVTSIEDSTFYGCTELKTIVIPASVTSIGGSAFYGCTGLTTITIPESVTSIEDSTFYGCTGLTTIVIPASVTSIGGSAFDGCTGLASITIPKGVTSIGSHAFYDCTKLKTLIIPDGITTIEVSTFFGCSSLTEISIPASVTSIANSAFRGCSNLSQVYYGGTAAQKDAITVDSRNDELMNAQWHCQENANSAVISVKPSEYGTVTANRATAAPGETVTVTAFPSQFWRIGYLLVNGERVDGLSFTVPEADVVTVEAVFEQCSISYDVLDSEDGTITLDKPAANPGEIVTATVTTFDSHCILDHLLVNGERVDGLTFTAAGEGVITVEAVFTYVRAAGTCGENVTWYLKNGGYLVIRGTGAMEDYSSSFSAPWSQYSYNIRTLIVESGVTHIGDYAFADLWQLSSISLAESVTSIGQYAFSNCSSLEEVSLPGNICVVETGLFYECSQLKKIVLGEGITTIRENAFFRRDSLEITLPVSLTTVEYNAVVSRSITVRYNGSAVQKESIDFQPSLMGDRNYLTASYYTTWYYAEPKVTLTVLPSEYGTITLSETETAVGNTVTATVTPNEGYIFVRLLVDGIEQSRKFIVPEGVDGIVTVQGVFEKEHVQLEILASEGGSITADCTSASPGKEILITAIPQTGYIFSHLLVNGERVDKLYFAMPETAENTVQGVFTPMENITASGQVGNNVIWILHNNGMLEFTGDGPMWDMTRSSYGHTIPWEDLCESITSVVIGNGITTIGANAFNDCKKITSFNIPSSVTTIGNGAFSYTSLTEFTIPSSITHIGNSAFYACSKLTSVTIPEGVTHIGDNAFGSCSQLTSVTLPQSLTHLEGAFSNCTGLTEMTIPSGVTTLSSSIFSGCTYLERITLHDGITEIGSHAFYKCSSLRDIALPAGLISIGSMAFYQCYSLTQITFPESLITIDDEAFLSARLETLHISAGITSIGDGAFGWNEIGTITVSNENTAFKCEDGVLLTADGTRLIQFPNQSVATEYSIPVGVTAIGAYAFAGSRSLTDVAIPNGITVIGDHAFSGCTSLESAHIPEGVTELGIYAFSSCGELRSVTVPGTVKDIRNYAFYECSKLASISLSNGLETIGTYAFHSCSALTAISLPDTLTTIGVRAFQGTQLSAITLPASLKTLRSGAFYGCSTIRTVYYSGTLTQWLAVSAEDSTATPLFYAGSFFVDGTLLPDTLVIPDGVTSIGSYAFYNRKMTQVFLPLSLTYVGDSAFGGCRQLHTVFYPGSEQDRYEKIKSGNGNTYLFSANWIYNNTATIYIDILPSEGGTVSVTTTTVAVGSSVTVTVRPESRYVFSHLIINGDTVVNGLTFSAPVAETVTVQGVFTRLPVPISVVDSVGGSIILPVTEAPVGTSITVTAIPEEGYAFSHMLVNSYQAEGTTFIVPDADRAIILPIFKKIVPVVGSGSAGENTSWELHDDGRVVISGSGSMDVDSPFGEHADKIKVVEIQTGVTTIGQSFFSGCTNLTSVTLPESVTTIDHFAFSGCSSLTEITLPASLTTVRDYAFESSRALVRVIYQGNRTQRQAISIGSMNAPLITATWEYLGADTLLPITLQPGHGGTLTLEKTSAYGYETVTVTAEPEDGFKLAGLIVNGTEVSGSSFTMPAGQSVTVRPLFDRAADVTVTGGRNGASWKVFADGYMIIRGAGEGPDRADIFMATQGSPVTHLIVEEGITSIGDGVFEGQAQLITISLPASVTTIESDAFRDCTSLTSVSMEGVTTIGESAFEGCTALVSIVMDVVIVIGAGAFYGCSSLVKVELPNTVTEIRENAFYGCSSLTTITIPASVTVIGRYAFSSCSSLTVIQLPAQLQELGEGAFERCSSLTEITIPAGITTLKAGLFYGCTSLTTVHFPAGLTTLEGSVFAGCIRLTILVLPDSITTIDGYAFSDCSGLVSITLPAGNTVVRNDTFRNCTSLTSITIPNGYTTVEENAFYGCSSLASVILPASLVTLNRYAFNNCSSLKLVTFRGTRAQLNAWDFDPDSDLGSVYWICADDITTPVTVLPSEGGTVTPISDLAVVGVRLKLTVTVQDGYRFSHLIVNGKKLYRQDITVTSADSLSITAVFVKLGAEVASGDCGYGCGPVWALYEDGTLFISGTGYMESYNSAADTPWSSYRTPDANGFCIRRIVVDYGVLSLGDHAFEGCAYVAEVILAPTVTSISSWTFYNCTALAIVVLPDSLEYIHGQAFGNCTNLQNIAFCGTAEQWALIEILGANSALSDAAHHYMGEEHTLVTVEVSAGNGGSVSHPANLAVVGSSVTVTVTMESGCIFSHLEVNGVTVNGLTFTVPDADTVSVTVIFIPAEGMIPLSVTCTEGGTATLSKYFAKAGEQITVYLAPEKGYGFSHMLVNGVSTDIVGFAVPDADSVTVEVVYVMVPVLVSLTVIPSTGGTVTLDKTSAFAGETVTATVTADNGYSFSHLLVDGVQVAGLSFTVPDVESVSIQAVFQKLRSVFLSVEASTGGTVTLPVSSAFAGTSVTATVTPDAGYRFSHLIVDGFNVYGTTFTVPNSMIATVKGVFEPETTNPIAASGQCGTGVSWTLYTSGRLIISGSGTMANFTTAPWNSHRASIITVEITDGVTSISSRAFSDCTNLTTVTIGKDVTVISTDAFQFCGNLRDILVDASNTVFASSDGALLTKDLTTLLRFPAGRTGTFTVPATVTVIDDYAFQRCTMLGTVVLNEGLLRIGNYAFESCINITSVNLPQSLTHIGEHAFDRCERLTSLTIPKAVSHIGAAAFRFCTNLAAIYVANGNEAYVAQNGVLFSADMTILLCCPAGKADSAYNVPASVTVIAESAFSHCKKLTQITMEAAVTEIGKAAFYACSGLTDVYFQGSEIQRNSITIGEENNALLNAVWHYSKITVTLTVVTSIGGSITLSATKASAGDTVTVSLTTAEGYQFSHLLVDGQKVTELTFTVPDVERLTVQGVFEKIPEAEGSGSFGEGLTWTYYSNGLLVIGGKGPMPDYSSASGAPWYAYRSRIKALVVENGVTSIGQNAFTQYSFLVDVTIGESIVSIGRMAFNGCRFTKITLPASVVTLEQNCFFQCHSLTDIYVADGSTAFAAVDGVLFTKDLSRLIQYPAGKAESTYTVPSSVTVIGYSAFRSSKLTSIVIPEGVSVIEASAFFMCSRLTELALPSSVTAIGESLIKDCRALAGISVHADNSTYVSVDGVLYSRDMTQLLLYPAAKDDTSYTIPATVTRIGDSAFEGSKHLTEIRIPSTVSEIGRYAFCACAALTDIILPTGIREVEFGAFRDCSSLKSIVVPGSARYIYNQAFLNCTALTEILLPAFISIVGTPFDGCESLEDVYYQGTQAQKDALKLGSNTALVNAVWHLVAAEGIVTSAATCHTAGEMTFACTDTGCTAAFIAKITPLEHNWSDWQHAGHAETHSRFCRNEGCSAYLTEAHGFTEEVVQAADYGIPGQKYVSCSACSYEGLAVIAPLVCSQPSAEQVKNPVDANVTFSDPAISHLQVIAAEVTISLNGSTAMSSYDKYILNVMDGFVADTVFEITLQDGSGQKQELEDGQTASVTLRISAEKAQKLAHGELLLVHVDNGARKIYELSELTIHVANGTVTFETGSFSPFVLAAPPAELAISMDAVKTASGCSVTVSANAAYSCNLILAAYDSQGRMLTLQIANGINLAGGINRSLSYSGTAALIKAFMMEPGSFTPKSAAAECTVNG